MTQPENILKGIIPVILAGGQGRRLRPLTNAKTPKPFLRLRSPHTLLQETVLRAQQMQPPALVANAAYREKIVHDMAAINIKPSQIFLEPEGRNTAPAVAAAAHYFSAKGNDPLLLVMPSDHAIKKPEALMDAVQRGASLARAGKFVLFGVKPSRPETGYGYIKCGAQEESEVFAVSSFVEKPPAAAARRFVRADGYLWNSGIFLFSAVALLARLKEINSTFHENSYGAVAHAARLQNAVFLESAAFGACPSESLDRMVMEKADNLSAIPVDMEWRDLGRWPDLIRHVLRAA